jgi:hypothetical protein
MKSVRRRQRDREDVFKKRMTVIKEVSQKVRKQEVKGQKRNE